MKKSLFYIVLVLMAVVSLMPLLLMAGKTVRVDTVSIAPVGAEGTDGFSTGVLLETLPDSPHETRLKIDVDTPLTSPYRLDDDTVHPVGGWTYFSPPLIYIHEALEGRITLYGTEPVGTTLWERGVITAIDGDEVTLNVAKKTALVVTNKQMTASGLEPGQRLSYRTSSRFSLRGYTSFLSDSRRTHLLGNTLAVALATVALAAVIGTLFALALAKINTPGRRILTVLYIVPLLVPSYISAIAWTQLLGLKGILTQYLMSTFDLASAPFTIYGVKGSVLVLSLTYFPIVTLLVSTGLRNLPAEMEEAGIMTAGRLRTLWHISIRGVLPYLFSAMVFVFIFTLSSSAAPFLLRLQLFSSQVLVAFQTDLSGAEAMTVGVPLLLLALGAVVFQGVMERRRSDMASVRTLRRGYVMDVGPWRWAALGFCAIVLLFAAGIPVGTLFVQMGSPVWIARALVEMGQEIKTSLWVSSAAATLAVAVGGLVGYLAARAGGRRGVLADVLVILPYAAPASVLAVGLIELFNRPGILSAVYGSSAILIYAFLIRFLPFAVKPVTAAVKTVHTELEDAARIHGISRFNTVLLVLRLSWKGLAAAWILVFILSIGELDAALLLHPAGLQTMPIKIFNAIHFGNIELVSALCLILIFSICLPLSLFYLVTAKRMDVG